MKELLQERETETLKEKGRNPRRRKVGFPKEAGKNWKGGERLDKMQKMGGLDQSNCGGFGNKRGDHI